MLDELDASVRVVSVCEMSYENCGYRLMYHSHMLFSNARSPLLTHFSAAIAGIGSVHLLSNFKVLLM